MTGKVAPDIVKPVPVNVAELMVTGAVPLELSVTGSVVGVFTVTLPNAKLAGLTRQLRTRAAVPVPLRLTTAVLSVDDCSDRHRPVAVPAVGLNGTFTSPTGWIQGDREVAPDT